MAKEEKDSPVLKSVSYTDKSGKEISIRVRQIENGYVIKEETYNPKAKKDEKHYTEREYYSQEKPKYVGEALDIDNFKLD